MKLNKHEQAKPNIAGLTSHAQLAEMKLILTGAWPALKPLPVFKYETDEYRASIDFDKTRGEWVCRKTSLPSNKVQELRGGLTEITMGLSHGQAEVFTEDVAAEPQEQELARDANRRLQAILEWRENYENGALYSELRDYLSESQQDEIYDSIRLSLTARQLQFNPKNVAFVFDALSNAGGRLATLIEIAQRNKAEQEADTQAQAEAAALDDSVVGSGVEISIGDFPQSLKASFPYTSPKSLQIGNPALKPTKANNFDVLVEHFFQPLGILQAGFFYKQLSDPIYPTIAILASGPFVGFQQQQSINGPNAHIAGFEAAWEQRLSRLPGLPGGFGVAANYSYTTSQVTFPAGFSGGRIDHPTLQRQAPNTWNLGFTYDRARFSIRFGVSHNDANIFAYGFVHVNPQTDRDPILGIKGPLGDQYLYAHTQFDVQGNYRLYKGLQFVAYGLNLSNEVFGFYTGSPIYPNQREYYHPTVAAGFRWSS